MPASPESRKASWISMANIILNRVGASTQPCFTPLDTVKVLEKAPWSRTCACITLVEWLTTLTNFYGHRSFANMVQSPSRFTVSKAFVRSTKTTYRSWCCSRHFSWSWHAVKTMSAVPRPKRKPHWLSGKTLSRLLGQPVEQDSAQNFTCWCQQGNASVVVTLCSIAFALVQMDGPWL